MFNLNFRKMEAEVLDFEPRVLENPLRKLVQDQPLSYPSRMSEAEFDRFVLENGDLRIERDKYGTITIHPPMTYKSAVRESKALFFLQLWGFSHQHLGDVVSPSGSFNLPDGAQCKADGSFVSRAQLQFFSDEELSHIPHLVPDFVMEVRSTTDRIGALKTKMEEVWIANGVRLAWLIDPIKERAWVYRANGEVVEIHNFNQKLSGEDVLPGFELDLNLLKTN